MELGEVCAETVSSTTTGLERCHWDSMTRKLSGRAQAEPILTSLTVTTRWVHTVAQRSSRESFGSLTS